MSEVGYSIHDLKAAPQFLPVVADRIWQEWWRPDGRSLGDVEAALGDIVAAKDFPLTLVAARGETFLGTVTGIASDIPARPDLGPCLAALWVEPSARGQGIGMALSSALLERLTSQGHRYVFLSAKPTMRTYYLLSGWTMIESDVDAEHQDVYVRELG